MSLMEILAIIGFSTIIFALLFNIAGIVVIFICCNKFVKYMKNVHPVEWSDYIAKFDGKGNQQVFIWKFINSDYEFGDDNICHFRCKIRRLLKLYIFINVICVLIMFAGLLINEFWLWNYRMDSMECL